MKRAMIAAMAVWALVQVTAQAWWAQAHHALAEAAVESLGADTPEFFRAGKTMIAHAAGDPDVIKSPETPAIYVAERPEHYIDWELLEGRDLPPTRYEYLALCAELGVDPTKAGLLPYAIMEWTDRLIVAFAEHRKAPNNPHIRQKALYIAGILAHYAADACQPLHCTIHYDGRALEDGSSPRSGVHSKVDGLPVTLGFSPDDFISSAPIAPFDNQFEAVLSVIEASRTYIDDVYAMEQELLATETGDFPKARDFALERCKASALFAARLYQTAWEFRFQREAPAWVDELRALDGE